MLFSKLAPTRLGYYWLQWLKKVNDTYGHEVGDEYIKIAAIVLKLTMPMRASIYRTDGYEFIVAIPNSTKEEV